MKCTLLGHDWMYGEAEDRCRRCDLKRDNPREITDEDPDAEMGDVRFRIDNSSDYDHITVERMKYQATGWGPEDEYRQWFPSGRIKVPNDQVDDLIEELEDV